MYRDKNQLNEYSFPLERALQDAGADVEYGPGTILQDFEALLGYVSERKMRVTGAHQLPLAALREINACLAQPIEQNLRRPVQKSFPPVHGLYLLLRASGLTWIDESGSKPHLVIDRDVHQDWKRLNPSEKFGTLLESWLVYGNAEIVGERRYSSDPMAGNFRNCIYFLSNIPKNGLTVAGNEDQENVLGHVPGWHNLGLLSLFGCIDIRHGTPVPGEKWQIECIYRTVFGEALFTRLKMAFFVNFDSISSAFQAENSSFGVLQPILQSYFPDWNNYLVVSGPTFRNGVHTFKVKRGRFWLRLAVAGEASLDALAIAILGYIDFDDDHLYEFSYRNRFGVVEQFNHPYIGQGRSTSEVSIGELPIRIGQKMQFLYDYGDHWEFNIVLESVDAGMKMEKPFPVLLELRGEPPRQYPRWD